MTCRIASFALALVFLAGCSGGKKADDQAAVEKSAIDTAGAEATPAEPIVPEREHIDRNAAAVQLPPEAKIGGTEGRSPFVGERVIGLNEIVNRSLVTMREFDTKVSAIRQDVKAAAEPTASLAVREKAAESMKTIDDLYDRAALALNDMAKAESDLKSSGEYFDEVIFYGMKKFVSDVESEIGDEKRALAKLGG